MTVTYYKDDRDCHPWGRDDEKNHAGEVYRDQKSQHQGLSSGRDRLSGGREEAGGHLQVCLKCRGLGHQRTIVPVRGSNIKMASRRKADSGPRRTSAVEQMRPSGARQVHYIGQYGTSVAGAELERATEVGGIQRMIWTRREKEGRGKEVLNSGDESEENKEENGQKID
ncbi:unnamed protein product [Mytilus coruscus]|uniref:Uncharacterized protein n=1 Tax=Mytilus coruscus TaxID=42192 RepID=A0A6J8BH10_MYTCO|nr:unnamed protein product [Mytilus coruscus]